MALGDRARACGIGGTKVTDPPGLRGMAAVLVSQPSREGPGRAGAEVVVRLDA